LIENCSFEAACQFNAESGAIDQVTLGDQPVDAINLQPVGHPWSISVSKLHFLLVRIFNILPQVLYSQPLLKDSLSL